jgi:hypothetical protein
MLGAAIAALALTALHLPARSGASATRGGGACAGDRWFVRTLQDRPKLLPVRATTLIKLRTLRRPNRVPATRHQSERQVVTLVVAAAPISHPDANGDLRLVLFPRRAGIPVVYATAPAPACNARATSYRRRQMGLARQAIISGRCTGGRITGVIFFSTRREDNETPNLVQLSPLLGYKPCAFK